MFFKERYCIRKKGHLALQVNYYLIDNIYTIYCIQMKKLMLCILGGLLFYSCKKNKTSSVPVEIQYQYSKKTYIGNTYAHFYDSMSSNVVLWDTSYLDSVVVMVDSAHDKIIFTANTQNPLQVYPQFEYDFAISSGYFRKNFVQNYYQSFYFEGDSLKSYFFHLQVGADQKYQKEIKFCGSKK